MKIRNAFIFLAIGATVGANIGLSGEKESKISVSLRGGWGLYHGADYNAAADDSNAARDLQAIGEGRIRKFTAGFNAGLEAVYWPTPRVGIGLGLGWYGSRINDNQIDFKTPWIDGEEIITASIDVLPVTLQLHYLLDLGGGVFADIFCGPGLYLGRFGYRINSIDNLSPIGYEALFEFNGRTTALGLQGGIGMEIPVLAGRLWIVGTVQGRYADLKDLKGEYTRTWTTVLGVYTHNGTEYKFWAFDRIMNGQSSREVMFSKETPSGGSIANLKEASIGGSGLSASFGLKLRI